MTTMERLRGSLAPWVVAGAIAWVGAACTLMGFLACVVCLILGSWPHRFAAVVLGIVHWPLVVSIIPDLWRKLFV